MKYSAVESASQALEVVGEEPFVSCICPHVPQREQQPPRERARVAIQTDSFPHMLPHIEESKLLPFLFYTSVFSFRQHRKGISLSRFTGSLKSGQQHSEHEPFQMTDSLSQCIFARVN